MHWQKASRNIGRHEGRGPDSGNNLSHACLMSSDTRRGDHA
jgi:hypothetical protein